MSESTLPLQIELDAELPWDMVVSDDEIKTARQLLENQLAASVLSSLGQLPQPLAETPVVLVTIITDRTLVRGNAERYFRAVGISKGSQITDLNGKGVVFNVQGYSPTVHELESVIREVAISRNHMVTITIDPCTIEEGREYQVVQLIRQFSSSDEHASTSHSWIAKVICPSKGEGSRLNCRVTKLEIP